MEHQLKYQKTHFGVSIEIDSKNHILLNYLNEHEIGLNEAKFIDRIIMNNINNEKFTIICDFSDTYANLTKEAQRFMAKDAESVPFIVGNGIIVNNLPVRILAKFFLNFFKPIYPTKIFANRVSALEWLHKIQAS